VAVSHRRKTAKQRMRLRMAKLARGRAKEEMKEQKLARDLLRCKAIIKEMDLEESLREQRRKRMRSKTTSTPHESSNTNESSSDSESESFMYSKTRFYGGGPSQPEPSEEDKLASVKPPLPISATVTIAVVAQQENKDSVVIDNSEKYYDVSDCYKKKFAKELEMFDSIMKKKEREHYTMPEMPKNKHDKHGLRCLNCEQCRQKCCGVCEQCIQGRDDHCRVYDGCISKQHCQKYKCLTCARIDQTGEYTFKVSQKTINTSTNVTCRIKNVTYIKECADEHCTNKLNNVYIGSTKQLNHRDYSHRSTIKTKRLFGDKHGNYSEIFEQHKDCDENKTKYFIVQSFNTLYKIHNIIQHNTLYKIILISNKYRY